MIKTAIPILLDVPNPLAKVTLLRSVKIRKCMNEFHDTFSNLSEPLPDTHGKKLKRKVQTMSAKLWRKKQHNKHR